MMMMMMFDRYDAATEDRQIVWKKMIINFIERSILQIKNNYFSSNICRFILGKLKLSTVGWAQFGITTSACYYFKNDNHSYVVL